MRVLQYRGEHIETAHPVSAVAVQADGLLVIGDKQGVLRCFALE